jgi:hypothetical protein
MEELSGGLILGERNNNNNNKINHGNSDNKHFGTTSTACTSY